MPDQDTKPTYIERPVEARQSLRVGMILGTLLWVVPLIIIIVMLALVLIGPAVGNVYSGIGPSL